MFYQNKNIIVIVTGSIAAFKAAVLVRYLIEQGAQVRVSLTAAGAKFVGPLTFSTLTKYPVLQDIFDQNDGQVLHVKWARWADYIFVVPATADFLAKTANGLADDAASSTLLASSARKIAAPAMNDQMWENQATKRNVKQLKKDGWLIIEPVVGFLAEGYDAKGRLPEPEDIILQAQVRLLAEKGSLKGKKILITAGGTREALDPVRYLTNRSSGKMGYNLAQAAAEAGAEVTIISPKSKKTAYPLKQIEAVSALEMFDSVKKELKNNDIFISAAAISDFRPEKFSSQKIKKNGAAGLTIDLVQNPDILAQAGREKQNRFIAGFAAETEKIIDHAKAKLVSKNADMIIANDVSRSDAGFSVDTNQVTIISKKTVKKLPLMSKLAAARKIIDEIAKELD